MVTDFISKGGGYVEQEMMNDLSLRTSIETEFQDLLYFLNNKIKILFLTGTNVFNGKRLRRRNEPRPTEPSIVVEPETRNQRPDNNRQEKDQDQNLQEQNIQENQIFARSME